MKFFYQTLLGHFRNLLLVGITGGEDALVDLPADELEKLKLQAEGALKETLQRYLEILMAEEETVRRSQNARLNLEAILCRMAWLEPLIPIETVLSRMEGLERRLAGGDAPPVLGEAKSKEAAGWVSGHTGRRTAQPTSSDDATPREQLLEERTIYRTDGAATSPGRWNDFKDFVKRQDAALCAKIESAQLLAVEEGRLRIGFAKSYLFRDDVEAGKTAIEDLARQFFGRETTLEIETLEPETAGPANANHNGNGLTVRAAKNHRLQEIRREALSHPFVQKVLDVFPRAEVRDVRLRETPVPAAVLTFPLPHEADLPLSEESPDLPPEEPSDD
jgi:DNA polymerase III gamma/tau subunit